MNGRINVRYTINSILIFAVITISIAIVSPITAEEAENGEAADKAVKTEEEEGTELEAIQLDYRRGKSSKKEKAPIEKRLEIFKKSSAKLTREYRIFSLPVDMKAKVLWIAPEYSVSSSNELKITENFVLTAAYDYEKTVYESSSSTEYTFEIDYRLKMGYTSHLTAGIGYSSGRAVDILDDPRFIVVYEKVF